MSEQNETPAPNDATIGDEALSPQVVPTLETKKKKGGCISPLFLFLLLAVVLVLAAIVAPNFVRSNTRGSLTACKSNLKNIGTALEMYSTDYGGKYPTSLEPLMPNYLKSIPKCPSTEKMSYRAYFGIDAPMNDPTDPFKDYYYIECYGGNHERVSITGNYPAYNTIQGLIERAPRAEQSPEVR